MEIDGFRFLGKEIAEVLGYNRPQNCNDNIGMMTRNV